MGSFSIWHWGVLMPNLLVFLLVFFVPLIFIVKKAGYSPWWALLGLIPIVNVFALWVFAFSKWPVESKTV
jgi:hypothetical protein